jgi:signal transduction histidine kinase/CHASE3 domain sensor protein
MQKLLSFAEYLKNRLNLRSPSSLRESAHKDRSTSTAATLAITLLLLAVIPSVIHEWSSDLRDRRLDVLSPLERALEQSERALFEINSDARGFLLSKNDDFLQSIPLHFQELDTALARMGKLCQRVGPDCMRLAESFLSRTNDWTVAYVNPFLNEARANPNSRSLTPLMEKGSYSLSSCHLIAEQLRSFLAERRGDIQEQIAKFTRWSLLASVLLGLIALLASGFLFRIARNTSRLYDRALASYRDASGKSTLLEAQLSFSQALLRSTPFAIAVVDITTLSLKYANSSFERLPFLQHSGIEDVPLRDRLAPCPASDIFFSAIDSLMRPENKVQIIQPTEFLSAEGKPSFWTLRIVPFGEKDAKPDQLLLLWENVTDELLAFRKLEIEKLRSDKLASELSALVDNMGDGVVVVNSDNIATTINNQARGLLNISRELRLPQPVSAFQSKAIQNLSLGNFATNRKNGPALGHQEPFSSVYPTETGRLLEVIVTPINARETNSAEPIGLIAVLHDITEYRKSERERVEFLALASQELKTPLTILGAAAQVIERSIRAKTYDQLESASGHLRAQVRRLNLLVMQLFEFARVEGQQIQVKVGKIDLSALVLQAVTDAKELYADHDWQIKVPSGPLPVLVDAEKIGNVLGILMTNAARFSPPSSTIQSEVDILNGNARVRVSDQGIGVSPEDQLRIFHRFQRGSNVGSVSGLGIGLYVASEIISKHGGRIWVESRGPNLGSQFYFEIPIPKNGA